MAVLDLGQSSFASTFLAIPPTHPCLVEFYASWCPACRAFASTYSEVGKALKQLPLRQAPTGSSGSGSGPIPTGDGSPVGGATAAPTVLVARVDCAAEPKLCATFKVSSYPTITAGAARDYAIPAPGAIRTLPRERASRTREAIVKWVVKELNLQVEEAALRAFDNGAVSTPLSVPLKPSQQPSAAETSGMVWTLADVESATLFLFDSIVNDPMLHTGPDKRRALLHLIRLWAAGHPSARCQGASQVLSAFYDTSWPEAEAVAPPAIKEYQICGSGAQRERWHACYSDRRGARGYTCGLWLMFHTCAQRLPADGDRGLTLMTALRSFNEHFFLCQVCQQHFAKILAAPEAAAVRTRRDAVLWLWQAHNEVNLRLMHVEAKYGHSSSGDPAHPKALFPSAEACAACRLGSNVTIGPPSVTAATANDTAVVAEQPAWNLDAVVEFLDRVYAEESVAPAAGLWMRAVGVRPMPMGWLLASALLLLPLLAGCFLSRSTLVARVMRAKSLSE